MQKVVPQFSQAFCGADPHTMHVSSATIMAHLIRFSSDWSCFFSRIFLRWIWVGAR
jgi:hypothetical protein